MIESIKLKSLRNNESIEFFRQIVAIITPYNPVTLGVKPEYDALNNIVATLEAVFKTQTGNPLSKELEQLDALRDNCIVGINYVIQGFAYNQADAKKYAAANALLNVWKVYGSGIAQQAYNAETATVRSVVADCKKPVNLQYCKDLGIDAWVLELERLNTLFADKFIERNKQEAADTNQPLEVLREKANQLYYECRDMLASQCVVNKKAPNFISCINEINNLIKNYNHLLEVRKSKGGDEEEGKDDSAK